MKAIKPARPKKILIIKPSSLGDIVHSLPFLNTVHKSFPESEIHWIVAKGFEGMLEDHPMIKKLWVIKKDEWKEINRLHHTVREMRVLYNELKEEGFSIVVDLQGLLRSGLIAKATNAPLRAGFKEAKEGSTLCYTDTVEGGRDIHAVDRYLKMAMFLGCDIADIRFPFPPLPDTLLVARQLSLPDRYVVLVPGARKPANRWPAERFGRLAAMLPVRAVVIGSRGDMRLAEAVAGHSKGNSVSIAGKTDLKGLISVIRGAGLVVSNDSGPMHIAAGLNVPVVAVFGPANPARTGPYGSIHKVIRKDVSCSPCYKRVCKSPDCLEGISVKEVASAVMDALNHSQ